MDVAKKTKKKKNNEFQDDKIPRKKSKTVESPGDNEMDYIIDLDLDHDDDKHTQDKHTGTYECTDTWTTEDYLELIKRMEVQIPKTDTVSFSCRAERLDWEQIRFGNHTVEECYENWKVLKTKVRHFRLLSEVLHDAKIWAETPWAAFNKKKVRHPDQPPRPLSSFMLFYMDKKSKIIKKHPEMKLTDISRLIGEKYKALSEEKKAYYVEKAKEMQEEYRQNIAKFYEKHPEMMKVTKRPLARSNKPLPPFKLYLNEKLLKHQKDENFNRHEYIEKYRELWKSLSNKKKAYWIKLAKEEEEKFLEHLHEEEGDEDEKKPATTYKSVISKEEQSILDRLAGKPEKPPNSAYSLFSKLMLQDKDKNLVDGEPKNRMKEVALKWKELPEEQKKAYAEKVRLMHEQYKMEMGTYLDALPEDKKAEELAKLQPKKSNRVRQKTVKKAVAVSSPNTEDGEELWKNEPKKPPVTAWDLFKLEFVKKNSHMPSKTAFKEAAAQWKTLSKKETEKYKKRHQQLKDKYMADFEQFLTTLNEEELKEYSAWKKAKSVQTFSEESLEEDSSEEEAEDDSDDDDEGGNSTSGSSDDSDSGVSEADA